MYAVEAPTVHKPVRGGLLPVANVIDNADGRITYDGVTYQDSALDGHARPVPTDGSEKLFDQVGETQGDPFSIYRGVEYSLGFQRDRATVTVQEAFGFGEGWAVERAVQTQSLNPVAVDITPVAGTPVTNSKDALGLLEQYAADNYSGLPLLHANRHATSLLVDQLLDDKDTWILHTKQGVPVANGGGYGSTGPGGVAAPAGAHWVYVSGQVNIWRGKVNIYPADVLSSNRTLALAEASYASTVDSFVAAILVGK